MIRVGHFGVCRRCGDARTRFGIYSGRRLPRSYYADIYGEMVKFVRVNSQHPAILKATEFFDSLLHDAGVLGQNFLGAKTFAMLYDRGTTGRDLLLECLSIATYQDRYRHNDAAFTPFVFVCGILKAGRGQNRGRHVKPRSGPQARYHVPGYRERAEIARMIRERLTPLFVNMLKFQREAERLRNAFLAEMSTEFVATCPACAVRAERRNLIEQRRAEALARGETPKPDMRYKVNRDAAGLGKPNPWGCKGTPKKADGEVTSVEANEVEEK